jgi:hypothetical protein
MVNLFRETLPEEHNSVKLHVIETHLVDWARRYSSIGLFSWDAGESIHALIMRYERMYYASPKGEKKNKLIIGKLYEVGDSELQRRAAARAEDSKRQKRA